MSSSKFDISTLKVLHTIYSPNTGGELTVVELSYGIVESAAVLDGTAKPIEARVSADGRAWSSEWHQGAESGDAVYVERHDITGCVFHGWVDATSRQIVQAG